MAKTERWPTLYDADDLHQTINELATRSDIEAVIYQPNVVDGGSCCQGDVLGFRQGVPYIDEDGEPSVAGEFSHWLVIGNSCDVDRAEVPWTQVVPIAEWTGLTPARAEALRRYAPSREFHVPYWGAKKADTALVADFLRPCALTKTVIGSKATVMARMSFKGWILLHACLVRFLARDDGRFD